MSLSEQIIQQVTDSGLNDYDQRSAIGIARSTLEATYKPIEPNSLDRKPKRDALAAELVALMEGHEKDDCIAALSDAREAVNAPFQVGIHSGASLMKPGAAKKARVA